MAKHAPSDRRRSALVTGLVTAAVVAVGLVQPTRGAALTTTPAEPPVSSGSGWEQGSYRPAPCYRPQDSTSSSPLARCYALGLATEDGRLVEQAVEPPATALGPADIQQAYNLPSGGEGQTVAIVVAFGYEAAESDLAVFRDHYGLPPCTTENGCFRKVDQNGGTVYPAQDPGWSIEAALDMDAVSAACPRCNILLVQADDNSTENLGIAVDTAADLGAVAINNSYGVPGEHPDQLDFDVHYDHPGIAVTAASGDFANLQSHPATNPNVVSVGGTTLVRDDSARGWSETVWSSAGSGCSLYEPRPDYQRDVDTGCPGTRATADISADADPASGLAVYNTLGQDGWAQYGGTSLSSPLVAAMYALAGDPIPGTYPVTYPYRADRRSQLFDVTVGSNGFCGNQLCNARPGWDGPTGWGTPNGTAALTLGEYGFVAGRITDPQHKPVPGVTLTATGSDGTTFEAVTDADGRYRLAAAVGGYRVVASKFGYRSQTVDVTVEAQATVEEDFTLATTPTRSLSGTVTDGSGHGWPVYAAISIEGYPGGTIYTDPYTGHYRVDLPAGDDYTLHVSPVDLPGYATKTATVEMPASGPVPSGDVTVGADAQTCIAPGYAHSYHGLSTGFEGWSGGTAQDGWTITDEAGTGKVWVFDDPGAKGNLTGGEGQFAIVDNWAFPTASQDTSLVSPSADLTDETDPVIGFDTYYYDFGFQIQDGDVDLSLDGGSTWSNVWHAPNAFVEGPVEIPIPQAAGESDVRVRFRFSGTNANWWELDNVYVGSRTCDPTEGGLVAGVVRDHNTSAPLVGATVSSDVDPDAATTTRATPEDAAVPDGYYTMFLSGSGSAPLTVTDRNYTAGHAVVDMAGDGVVRRDWRLEAGRLAVRPSEVSASTRLGRTASETVTVTNTGTQPAHVNLVEQDRGYTSPDGQTQSTSPGAPLIRRKVPASPEAFALRQPSSAPTEGATPAVEGAWSQIADYPTPIMDNLVAENDGLVYSVGGITPADMTAGGYVYNPATESWRPIADLPQPREAPTGAFVNGKLYVVGGWNAEGIAMSTTYAYDPETDGWTQVADLPAGISAGAAASVDGQLYVVGGCTTGNCDPASVGTYRYDPRSDMWTRLADYPDDVAFLACAPAPGGIVCAGGLDPDFRAEPSAATYRYDATTNTWTRVADMPYSNWAMAYAGSGGKLQVVGGVANFSVSNQAAEYDPAGDTWSALPNANSALYRGGGACGLYKIGGAPSGFSPTPIAEQLPGYDACIQGSEVAWLSADPTEFTVLPGQQVTVTVTLDAAAVSQPGDYAGRLAIATDTPYRVPAVPVTMQVRP